MYLNNAATLNAAANQGMDTMPPKPQTIAEMLIIELDRLVDMFNSANNRNSYVADRILGPIPETPKNGEVGCDANHPILTIALQQRMKRLQLEAQRAHSIADRYEQVA